MGKRTTIYLRGALTGPVDAADAHAGTDLGFNGDAATQLQVGPDGHVYVDQGGALVVETVPLTGPSGGYGQRRTFPAWRIIEVEEVEIR